MEQITSARGFDRLLGNEQLKRGLAQSVRSGRTSHFYLISGPEGSGKHTLAMLLAQALLCQGAEKPCGVCNACRKVRQGIHPDVISVVDPEHKNVSVKIVRDIREDLFIRPNEGRRKIYVFPQELGLEGMNALLKVLEEPPEYGVFLLLTDNSGKILPTVRSRCTELKLQPLPRAVLRQALLREFPQAGAEAVEAAMDRGGGFLGQARALLEAGTALPEAVRAFAQCYAARDALGLLGLLAPMEKSKRDALTEHLTQWQALLNQSLACRSGMRAISPEVSKIAASRSPKELMAGLDVLATALEYAQSNVSPAAICGWLAWELR